jgi:hypothetical protein
MKQVLDVMDLFFSFFYEVEKKDHNILALMLRSQI